MMIRASWLRLAAAVALAMAGCAPKGAAGLPSDALDKAIAVTIGDPNTCVVLAERVTGRVVYRYGEDFNCARSLPACDRPGNLSANNAVGLAQTPGGRGASCNTSADGSRTVGWAEGRVAGSQRDLVYSAMMEGETALPGREIEGRLDAAFAKAGL